MCHSFVMHLESTERKGQTTLRLRPLLADDLVTMVLGGFRWWPRQAR